MIKVRRIGHATFETPDLSRMIDYHTHVTGLMVASQDADRAFLSSRTGQLAVELRRAPQAKCSGLCFEVGARRGFRRHGAPAHGAGHQERSAERHRRPASARCWRSRIRRAPTIEVFNEWKSLARNQPFDGVGVLKLGHLAFCVDDPKAISEFYAKVLGFKVSDWISDMFVFMRCNADHHTVNFIVGPHGRMHHVAFELRDAAHLHISCDVLGEKDIKIVWGPVRLGPGHNVATFHRNPDDQVVEMFAELDQMKDEALGYYDPQDLAQGSPAAAQGLAGNPGHAICVGPAAVAGISPREEVGRGRVNRLGPVPCPFRCKPDLNGKSAMPANDPWRTLAVFGSLDRLLERWAK